VESSPSLKEDFFKNVLNASINQAYLVKGHYYEDLSTKADNFNKSFTKNFQLLIPFEDKAL
jgi:hypothetical protein